MQTTAEVCTDFAEVLTLGKATIIFFVRVETVARSPKGQVLLVLLGGFAECGNRKALRLRAQGVYSCK